MLQGDLVYLLPTQILVLHLQQLAKGTGYQYH